MISSCLRHSLLQLMDFVSIHCATPCKWVSVTMAWCVLRLRMRKQPPIWRVATNILKNQSQTLAKGGPPAWGLGEVLTTPHHKNISCYKLFTRALDMD